MPTSEEISNNLHTYGDIQLSCPVHITRGVHDKANEIVLQYTCGLFNSGGGILIMKNVNKNNNVASKHLDVWWSGMECNIASMLSQDDLCNFVDFVGNFDEDYFYLFVKSAEHLCTIDYNCRLPTDTATHGVTYRSAVSLCASEGVNKSLALLPSVPLEFEYGKTEESLKQEGKQIQFKYVTSRDGSSPLKSLSHKVDYYSTRYISAFANHEGGHIYFGIEDTNAAVFGEQITEQEEKNIENHLVKKMKAMIWGDTKFIAEKGTHWDVKFFPVKKCPKNAIRKVIVISVCKMYGGVFTASPESYFIEGTVNEYGINTFHMKQYNFEGWKTQLLNNARDCPSLHSRFVKIALQTPTSHLVFSLPHTLQAIRQKIIKLNEGMNLQPKGILHSFPDLEVRSAIQCLMRTFSSEPHLVISLDSWGLNLPMLPDKPDGVKACLTLLSSLYGIHVVCLVSDCYTEEKVWCYTKHMAISLKQALVTHGGCNCHIGIKSCVLDIHSPIMLQLFQGSIDFDIFPQTYQVRVQTMELILNALAIAIASYKPFCSDDQADDHYFLLTCDQLELLWTHQHTKELWIHGPPGAGKTVAALEMVQELRRRGCDACEVLYVAENSLLCSYVGSFNICMVCSRRELMKDAACPAIFKQKYQKIMNVIVDEAQNFKDRDGDWYSVLEKLSKQNVSSLSSMTAGYFWVFMDYAQKVHKFKAGLPGLIGKNNFMLSEISRNCKEIFEYASKFMGTDTKEGTIEDGEKRNLVEVAPTLGHHFSSGHQVNVLKCDKSSIHDMLFNLLQKFTDEGGDVSDLAILVSKKADSKIVKNIIDPGSTSGNDGKYTPQTLTRHSSPNAKEIVASSSDALNAKVDEHFDSVEQRNLLDSSMECDDSPGSTSCNSKPLLVSTVREFSGLDRPHIIGIEPHTNPEHADLDKLILNMATRARDSLVILTTSDEMVEKLKPGE